MGAQCCSERFCPSEASTSQGGKKPGQGSAIKRDKDVAQLQTDPTTRGTVTEMTEKGLDYDCILNLSAKVNPHHSAAVSIERPRYSTGQGGCRRLCWDAVQDSDYHAFRVSLQESVGNQNPPPSLLATTTLT